MAFCLLSHLKFDLLHAGSRVVRIDLPHFLAGCHEKATKPGSNCHILACFFIVLLFIRACFYVLLVFVGVCSVLCWLFWLIG